MPKKKPKKKRNKGKAKGTAFERNFCKELSLWWSKGKDDDVFYRAQNSGARATVRTRAGKKTRGHYGDVAAVDSRGAALTKLCVISLKKGYNTITPADFFDLDQTKEQQLAIWIREAERDRKAADVPGWMIVHQRDRRKKVVYINKELWFSNFITTQLALEPMLVFFCSIRKKEITPAMVKKLARKGKTPKKSTMEVFMFSYESFHRKLNKKLIKRLAKSC